MLLFAGCSCSCVTVHGSGVKTHYKTYIVAHSFRPSNGVHHATSPLSNVLAAFMLNRIANHPARSTPVQVKTSTNAWQPTNAFSSADISVPAIVSPQTTTYHLLPAASTPPSVAKSKDTRAEHSSSITPVAVSSTTVSTLPTPPPLLPVNIILNQLQWRITSGSSIITLTMALLPPTRLSQLVRRRIRSYLSVELGPTTRTGLPNAISRQSLSGRERIYFTPLHIGQNVRRSSTGRKQSTTLSGYSIACLHAILAHLHWNFGHKCVPNPMNFAGLTCLAVQYMYWTPPCRMGDRFRNGLPGHGLACFSVSRRLIRRWSH